MKQKVFASDFDGTLYFYKAEVKLPPENVEKIRAYQAAGHLFGLCTGRQVVGLSPFLTGLVEPDFYITSSGASIGTTSDTLMSIMKHHTRNAQISRMPMVSTVGRTISPMRRPRMVDFRRYLFVAA